MGVAHGSSVGGGDVRNLVLTESLALDFAELERGFLCIDGVSLEAPLGVVKHAEVLAGFGDRDNILEANGVAMISSDFVVNLDVGIVSVSADLEGLLAGESVPQSVAEENSKGDALTKLVGSSRWTSCVNTFQLVKAPVGRCEHSLHVLFGSSCLKMR